MDWFLYDRDLRHEGVKVKIEHQILIKLRTQVCCEDPGKGQTDL